MSQPKLSKTTTISDSLSSLPDDSYHHIPLQHITKGYEDKWRGVFVFNGNCMKRRPYGSTNDPEEIEKRDEYKIYGVDDYEYEICKVFPEIDASFRICKYGQPNFLKLYFTGLEYFSDLGVKKLTRVMRANFTKVEGLVLDLRSCVCITGISIEHISSKIIRNFSHLKHLRLNFFDCESLSEKAFMMLSQDISNYLPNFTHLFLNFLSCKKIRDEGVKFFAHHVSRKLTKLTHLKIDFSFCKISEKGLTTLYKDLGQRLPNLKFLEIHTRGLYSLKDETFKALEENIIKRLPALKHLSIRIGSVSEISSKAFESLFYHLGQRLSGLTFLNVELESCDQINDNDVRNLLTQIHENCKNLVHVKLHFEKFCHVKGTQLFPDKQAITDYLQAEFKTRGELEE